MHRRAVLINVCLTQYTSDQGLNEAARMDGQEAERIYARRLVKGSPSLTLLE